MTIRRPKSNNKGFILAPNAVPVIGLIGQSNMDGWADIATLPTNLQGPQTGRYILNDDEELEVLEAGVNNRGLSLTQFGPEMEFARRLYEHLDQPIYILKYARSGTKVAADAASEDWNADTGELTSHFLTRATAIERRIRALGKEPAWLAVVDTQGISDANAADAPNYEDNKRAQYAKIRKHINRDLPIIVGRIHSGWSTGDGATIRTAQETIGNETGARWFDTDDLTRLPDDNHYDTNGQIEHGRRIFEEVKYFLKTPRTQLPVYDPGASPLLLSQWEWINSQSQWNDTEKKAILARRYATKVVSTSQRFVPDHFSIPAAVSATSGATWVDDYLGYKYKIVRLDNRKIHNCERWIVNNAGIFFMSDGSGTSNRDIYFFQHGEPYPVLGQTGTDSHVMTVDVNAANGSEAIDRVNNAWFLTDTIIAWPNGTNTIKTRDILTGAETNYTVSFTGSEYLNVTNSDGAGERRAYTNPITDPLKQAYNTENPTLQIEDDKVYKMFHVSADRKQYIILVYTISTGAWTYLSGTATPTESSSVVVNTIQVDVSSSIDYLSMSASGKRVISNTNETEGSMYHYPDGTKVPVTNPDLTPANRIYSNSNHKGFGTLFNGMDWFTEELSGTAPDNTTFGGKAGDMFFLGVHPTTGVRHWIKCVDMPTGDDSTLYGGDQGGHSGFPLGAHAGHRSEEPNEQQTWTKQVVMLDPARSALASPDLSKFGRFRVAKLNVTTGGGNGDDPGATPGIIFEDPDNPGRYIGEVYFHDTDVDHNGTLREGIFYAEIQLVPDHDNFATTAQALADSDLISDQ